MGLFDIFRKKKKKKKAEIVVNAAETTAPAAEETEPEQIEDPSEISTVGWDAIDADFLRVYPGQTSPLHYGTLVKWIFGGNDPLDGISVYDGGDFYHFVTYGLTELYAKQSRNTELSGYGYEMTLKLKKEGLEDEETEIKGICGLLQTIARITFTKNECFFPNEYIYTGQTTGMDVKQQSRLTGFIVVTDPTVETLETFNGRVEFRELVGVTDAELKSLIAHEKKVAELYEELGSDITDYQRESVVQIPGEPEEDSAQ